MLTFLYLWNFLFFLGTGTLLQILFSYFFSCFLNFSMELRVSPSPNFSFSTFFLFFFTYYCILKIIIFVLKIMKHIYLLKRRIFIMTASRNKSRSSKKTRWKMGKGCINYIGICTNNLCYIICFK